MENEVLEDSKEEFKIEGLPCIINKEMTLVHYGSDKFLKRKFKPIKDKFYWNKPLGGLWTSPVNSEYGWREWCMSEEFRTESFNKSFIIKFSGRVFVIDCLEDMERLPWKQFDNSHVLAYPLFEPLVRAGIDAIHLTVRGQEETRLTFPRSLYGWDCESVLVMNLESIKPVKK